jgi:RNA polymerase-binding transcription factor DksA
MQGEGSSGSGGAFEQRTALDYELLVAEAERTLDDVDYALERIDHGAYGTCEVCGAPIADDYLEEMPTARTCERHLRLSESAP